MMTLWCMFRSPLMVGAELTKLDDWTLSLLTNKELLAMLGETCHGTQLMRTENAAIWKNEDEENGRICVGLFNLSDEEATLSISWKELCKAPDKSGECRLYELWSKEETDTQQGQITALVPAHGVKVYRIE